MPTQDEANIDPKEAAIKRLARASGYSKRDIEAGFEFYRRKNRLSNPPGHFDRAGRFYSDERTESVRSARAPSSKWPYSEMTAARTAVHCAQLYKAAPLHARRIAKAITAIEDLSDDGNGDLKVQVADVAQPILKKVTQPKKTTKAASA